MGGNVSAGEAEDKQHDNEEVVEGIEEKESPGGKRRERGGGERRRKETTRRWSFVKMKSFGAHGRFHAKRNNLNIYIKILKSLHGSTILYFLVCTQNLFSVNSPGNCVFGLVLTVQPQPGPDPCSSLTHLLLLYLTGCGGEI
jgi:hypothetical protein